MRRYKKRKTNHLKIIAIILPLLLILLFFEPIKKWIDNPTYDKEETKEIKEKEGVNQEEESEIKEDIEKDIEKNINENNENIEEPEQQTSHDRINEKIQSMSIEEKIAQLFIITPEALTNMSQVIQAGDTTKESLEKYPVGGLIYFLKNITTREELKLMLSNTQAYSEEITGLPLFLSIDEEGGEVTRIASSGTIQVPLLPNMSEIGLTENPKEAYQVGVTLGSYLAELGFNLNFAPDADVLTNPENTVVKNRSFGADAGLVSQMVLETLRGMNEQGIYGTLKHFPGHGATEGDTHEGYAYTNKTLEEMLENEMLPFTRGIEENTSFIMAGHISVPNIIGDDTPSSLSKVMITDILRNQLEYDGIIITDALNMGAIAEKYSSAQAAIKAFEAGSDLLLMPADFVSAYEGVLQAVKSGEISEERVDESLSRILKVKFEMMDRNGEPAGG